MTTPLRPDELQQTTAALEGAEASMGGGYTVTPNPAYRGPDPSTYPFVPVKPRQSPATDGLGFKVVYLKGVGGHAIPWIEKPDSTKRLATVEEEKLWNRVAELEKQIDEKKAKKKQ